MFFLSKISIFGFLFFKTDGVDRSRVADIKSGVFLASEKILAILDTPQGLSAWQKSPPVILAPLQNGNEPPSLNTKIIFWASEQLDTMFIPLGKVP